MQCVTGPECDYLLVLFPGRVVSKASPTKKFLNFQNKIMQLLFIALALHVTPSLVSVMHKIIIVFTSNGCGDQGFKNRFG